MKRSAVVLASLSLLALTCKKEPPPAVQVPALELVAEDASCTEAWLRIRSLQVPATVQLIQVAPTLQTKQTLRLTSSDSLVIDEGLLPNRTYTYKAQLLEPQTPNLIASTPDVHVTTMDTTNHNFTWQIDTLGDGGGSVLYDVAIINDTLAYAVGEIYKRDSVGNWDPLPYNLVKWNGRQWELQRVTVSFRGSPVTVPLEGIFAHSATDIWVAGSIPIHGNGTSWIGYDIQTLVGPGATVSKAWGTSSEMYFVGRAGNIIHYDGVRWRRIESGTTLPIMDIYGAQDPRTGRYEILCVAEAYGVLGGSKILAIKNSTVEPTPTLGLSSGGVEAIWCVPNRLYVATGDGLWQTNSLDGPWSRNIILPALFKTAIDGKGLNDFVVCGAFLLLGHYNGVSWQTYFPITSGAFGAVQLKENLTIAVGVLGSGIDDRALIVIGRR